MDADDSCATTAETGGGGVLSDGFEGSADVDGAAKDDKDDAKMTTTSDGSQTTKPLSEPMASLDEDAARRSENDKNSSTQIQHSTDENKEIEQSPPTVAGDSSSKSITVDENIVNDSIRQTSNFDQSANIPMHSDPMTQGSSSVGNREDQSVELGVAEETNNNISPQMACGGTAAEEKENICESPSRDAAVKTVRFASSSKVRQFDVDCSVSSLLEEDECDVQLQNNSGKELRRRKRARHATNLTKTTRNHTSAASNALLRQILSPDSAAGSNEYLTQSKSEGEKLKQQHVAKKKKQIQIVLLHSHSHTQILHHAMKYIHQDRDLLLESLLKWCGIFHGASRTGALSSFLSILPPKMGTRKLLETFHDTGYLDLLQFPPPKMEKNTLQSSKSLDEESGGSAADDDMSEEQACNSSNGTIDLGRESTVNNDGDDTCHSSFEQQMKLSPMPSEDHMPSDEILSKYGLEDDCPIK